MKHLTTLLLTLLISGGLWADEVRLSCKAYSYYDSRIIPPYEQKELERRTASLLINSETKKVTYSGQFIEEFDYIEEGNSITFDTVSSGYRRPIYFRLDRVTGEFSKTRINLDNGYRLEDTDFRCERKKALF